MMLSLTRNSIPNFSNLALIPPILDRFDVAVEAKFPGVANVLSISQETDVNISVFLIFCF